MKDVRVILVIAFACTGVAAAHGQAEPASDVVRRSPVASLQTTAERAIELARQADAVADQSQSLQLRRKALEGFLALRTAGVRTAALEYNLATLYIRLDEPGRAIAAALRAARLAPRDDRIENNLRVARHLRDGRFGGGPSTMSMSATTIIGVLRENSVWLCLVAWNLAWLPILIAARRGRASGITLTSGLIAMLAGIATVSLAATPGIHSDERMAVIVSGDATPRKGCGIDYDPATRLPPANGTEVRWIEVREDGDERDWYRVALPERVTAWIQAEAIELIE